MKMNESVKKIVTKVVEDIIDIDEMKWPPTCTAVLAQPVRPKSTKEVIEE